ncbi:hypothetical protein IB254_01975 [Pseudomonas sp. PDM03]|uniref:hypothetical protein n=1 Tax=Pseudomonas sp. PDM03 TaxID=2769266 RepID=UPI001781B84C|nr:hypothetical protein [Pseudomonas sp. PDM03]MBD9585813.1 hypothetical protein [Pseudomonas sp. PDM03]
MMSTIQIVVATLMAFIALLFTIARATPEEKAKVIGWGRQSTYFGFLLLLIGICTYSIISFVAGEGQPTRAEIANFVFATLLSIWYAYLLFDRAIEIRRAKHSKKIEKLESELDDLKHQALALELEGKIMEKLSALFSALLGAQTKDVGGPHNDRSR